MFFKYGTTTPSETIFARLEEGVKEGWNWVAQQFGIGVDEAKKKVQEAEDKAKDEL